MMKIMVTGLMSLHPGRLENGNIGNYYITEPLFRELHRVFPSAEIATTFQMSPAFCKRELISLLPLELFYNWDENDVPNSLRELASAELFATTGKLYAPTRYIEEVLSCDLVLDVSGEMWGDHAEPVGHNRFLVDLCKFRTAQLLNRKTVLFAGSQGPFSDAHLLKFAREVFENFDLVANRESTSKDLLREYGFNVSRVENYVCPAFLFEPCSTDDIAPLLEREKIPGKRTVGYILCGFNMLEGPYDKSPREDSEFTQFAETVEHIVNVLECRVVLLSHQNGFEREPEFHLVNGRDYPIIKQLYCVLKKRGKADMNNILCMEKPFTPKETKAIIGQFDMLVSGRVHAFTAGVSQCVPSVLITRGFGQKSHRNIGFARIIGMEHYIADPHSTQDMIVKVDNCWNNKRKIREYLEKKMPEVKQSARDCFDSLKKVVGEDR